MRTSFLSALILLSNSLAAQSWCRPGATWVHGVSYITLHGTETYTYEGDTMIGDVLAQRISLQNDLYSSTSPFDTSYIATWMMTREEDGIVYKWSGPQQSWDTLFWFSAGIGDQWDPAFTNPLTSSGTFIVTDVTYIEVDGILLKQLHLNEECTASNWVSPIPHLITERIGWCFAFGLFNRCEYMGHGPAGLLSYSDSEISIEFPSGALMSQCNIILSHNEHASNTLPIHPNPGTDHFTLQLPPGPRELTLFDAQGRLLLRQQLSEERPVISTASLPSGIYHIHITDPLGRSSGQRWVKQ